MDYANMSDGSKGEDQFQDEIGVVDGAEPRKSKQRRSKKSSKSSKAANEEEGTANMNIDGGKESPRRSATTSARHSATVSTNAAQRSAVGLGVDRAVQLSDEEEPSSNPPPQSSGDGQSASQKPSGSKKQKREMNKDFKELQETGRWGAISKRDIVIVVVMVLLVVIAVIAVVVVLTTGGDSTPTSAESMTPPPAPTASPTAKVVLTPEEQLTIIRAATIDNPATEGSMALLPEDPTFYVDKAADPNESPVVRAASWIMYDDPWDEEEWLMVRYSLAVLFYTTGGESWSNKSGWLTDDSACAWNGVRCDRFDQRVEEIDLSENNMTGSIPAEIGLISSLVSLWLRRNNLSGKVPSLALGAMSSLSILYLDQNTLTGTIGKELAASGVLSTLFLQANTLTGVFPYEFCPDERTNVTGLIEFGIDCNEMQCFCCWPDNCF